MKVAKTGRRIRGRDRTGYQGVALSSHFRRRGQLPLKDRNVVNYGIRGEERANRVLVTSPGKADGQSARRRRVALLWFCDDVFGRNKGSSFRMESA